MDWRPGRASLPVHSQPEESWQGKELGCLCGVLVVRAAWSFLGVIQGGKSGLRAGLAAAAKAPGLKEAEPKFVLL